MSSELLEIEYSNLENRKINEETCRKWKYGYGYTKEGRPVHIATYCDDYGKPVAQKLRGAGKEFSIVGDASKMGLYGKYMWQSGGKILTICEGELDALSVSQQTGNKYAVVSIPNGCQSAKKIIAKELEWIETFESCVFMFDQDEQGQQAAKECALMLSPGKAKIAYLPLKDASEMLQAGRGSEIIQAQFGAKIFRPDGIVSADTLWEKVSEVDNQECIPYPWDVLNLKTGGIRKSELVCLTAGTGIGKSSVCREICYWLLKKDLKVGYIALEESVKRTAQGIIGLELNKPIHLHGHEVDEATLKKGFDATLGQGNLTLYDHFGSTDADNLLNKVRYMSVAMGAEYIVLDHLSIVVSGYEDGDERRRIDNVMTKLRSLVEELGICLFLVSHLKRPMNTSHEEGGQTSLAQLRGSQAIPQLSDIVLGFERNQQDSKLAHVTCMRVLKNRYSGETGISGYLKYDRDTGRLHECDLEFESESQKFNNKKITQNVPF